MVHCLLLSTFRNSWFGKVLICADLQGMDLDLSTSNLAETMRFVMHYRNVITLTSLITGLGSTPMNVSWSVSRNHLVRWMMIAFGCSVDTITVATTVCIGGVCSVAPIFRPYVDVRSCSRIASFLVAMLHALHPLPVVVAFLHLLGVCLAAVSVVRLVPTLFVRSFDVAVRVRQFVLALQLAARFPRLLCVRSDSQQK